VFPKRNSSAARVRLLTIWFGANDASLPPKTQHVPLPDFASGLTELITLVTSPESEYYSPDTRIILIAPPPFDPTTREDRRFEVTRQYAEAVKQVGTDQSVPVVDAFEDIWKAASEDLGRLGNFFYDGLHLNEAGYKVKSDALPISHYGAHILYVEDCIRWHYQNH
jgi:isoamyl acetate esterase